MKKDFHVFSHIPTLRSGFALGVALLATSTAFAATHVLATLNDNLTAADGDVLTGTLDGYTQCYKISIADGAAVTLENAIINGVDKSQCSWAGITCEGNCTIILEGENTVKGFYTGNPGIYIPRHYTLTIEGDGSLEASGAVGGAGIGCSSNHSCGSIEIKSGTIKATGGNLAAGIGSSKSFSGLNVYVGDITISGGSVTAIGGIRAAGIGMGWDDQSKEYVFGDITIGEAVTVTAIGGEGAAGIGIGQSSGKATTMGNITIVNGFGTTVTAEKGAGALHSIGIGSGEGSIKSIAIGAKETAYIVTSPFTYPKSLFYVSEYPDGKKAVINGNFYEEDAINITEEIPVDHVVFEREFSTSGYSTLMLPFDYVATNFENVEAIIEFGEMTTNGKGDPAVGMNFVWCSKDVEDALAEEAAKTADPDDYDRCNTDGTKFPGNMTAYTPYMALMGGDELVFKAGATLAPTAGAITEVSHDGWTFKAPLQRKTFTKEETQNGTIWGFAGENRDGATIGKFVWFGKNATVLPFRAYMESSSPLFASASPNAQFVARPAVGETASIESIDVVIVSRNDGEKHTTTIGKLNTRTGEFKMLRDYDLKGRKTNVMNRARGAYYGKNVLKK